MNHSAEQMHSPFVTLREMAGRLDGAAVGELLGRASDIVLTLDADGVVRDAVFSSGSHDRAGVSDWIGRAFRETVTVESRNKADRLVDQARRDGAAGPRHMNHAVSVDEDLPVAYSAHRAGRGGELILFGRDLSDVAGMQRRLIAAQQTMEREYERQRQLDARYRHLFRTARESVIVMDAASGRVREANPPAGRLFGRDAARLAGHRFIRLFEREDAPALEAALNAAAAGRPDAASARPGGAREPVEVEASLFRAADEALLLIRIGAGEGGGGGPRAEGGLAAEAVKLLEDAPDGVLLTDSQGRIRWVNDALLEMADAALREHLVGAPLEDIMGRSGVDADVLLDSLRRQRQVRQFGTVLRGPLGEAAQVEISGAALEDGDEAGFGFVIRDTALRAVAPAEPGAARSTEQLAALVGTAPLKDLVRESTDLIEKMCIETALEMTGDNRASAAELLGLSRQSLYSKMRRFGIGELPN